MLQSSSLGSNHCDTRTLEFQGWDLFVHGKWTCDTPTHSIKSILCLYLGLPSMSQTWMQQNADYIWWYWYWKVKCWIDWSVLMPATRFNTYATIFDDERTTWNLLASKNIVCLCVGRMAREIWWPWWLKGSRNSSISMAACNPTPNPPKTTNASPHRAGHVFQWMDPTRSNNKKMVAGCLRDWNEIEINPKNKRN